jgi:hypothetical protein
LRATMAARANDAGGERRGEGRLTYDVNLRLWLVVSGDRVSAVRTRQTSTTVVATTTARDPARRCKRVVSCSPALLLSTPLCPACCPCLVVLVCVCVFPRAAPCACLLVRGPVALFARSVLFFAASTTSSPCLIARSQPLSAARESQCKRPGRDGCRDCHPSASPYCHTATKFTW